MLLSRLFPTGQLRETAFAASGSVAYAGTRAARALPRRLRFLAAMLALGMLLPPLTVHDLQWFSVGLSLAGVFLAPTTIVAFQLLDDLAIRGTQTEAQAWLQTAVVFGVAVGASLAGWAVDRRGPVLASGLGAAMVAVATLIAQPGRGALVAGQTEPLPH